MEITECLTSNLENMENTVSNPSPDLDDVEHTFANLDESAIFNYVDISNTPERTNFDESILQLPEMNNISIDPTFDSVLSQPKPISNSDEKMSDSQMNLDGQDNAQQAEAQISFDDLPEDLLNFEIPDFTADDFSADPFSTDSECYNDNNSSRIYIPSQGNGPQLIEMGSDQNGLLQNQLCTGSFNGVVQGVEEQTCYMLQQQQQEAGFTSYQVNYEMYANSFMEWVMQQPYPECQSCQLMRRIVHSNGSQDTKVEVHCDKGQNFHAVMQKRAFGNEGQTHSLPEPFPKGNQEYMKHFLMQYSLLRAREGYALRYDSVMIDTGTEIKMSTITDPCFPQILPCPQADSNFSQVFGKPALNTRTATNCTTQTSKPPKSSIAAQRERTKELRLSDIQPYFNLPIKEASGKLKICVTVLKKVRRDNGITRWPYRKIKPTEDKIEKLEGMLRDGNRQDAESIINEIAMLKEQLAQYYGLSRSDHTT